MQTMAVALLDMHTFPPFRHIARHRVIQRHPYYNYPNDTHCYYGLHFHVLNPPVCVKLKICRIVLGAISVRIPRPSHLPGCTLRILGGLGSLDFGMGGSFIHLSLRVVEIPKKVVLLYL